MEWVIVRFPHSRDVFIDESLIGATNTMLTIEAGPHSFDLGPTGDYRPAGISCTIADTEPDDPAVVTFLPA